MDQKKFEELCYQLGNCVRHADAATADSRTKLTEGESHPVVIKSLKPAPHTCEDCDRELPDRKVRTHTLKPTGWRSHCSSCNQVRQPGNNYYGQRDPALPSRLGVRPELLLEPIPEPLLEPQLDTIESDSTTDTVVQYVEQVIVRDCHESLIREFVKIPVNLLPDSGDAQEPGSEVRTG